MAYPPPPYKDARTGTPLTGEAITGKWWAYPSSAALQLGGVNPALTVFVPGAVPQAGLGLGAGIPVLVLQPTVPSAGLGLGAPLPSLVAPDRLFPNPAGLALRGVAPQFKVSQILHPLAAGLGLGSFPLVAQIVWILPADCTDLALDAAACEPVPLTPASCDDVVLEPMQALEAR